MDTGTVLSDKPSKLMKRYKKALADAGYEVDKLIVFGSYAKGAPRYESDLDVCVVSKKFGADTFDEEVKLSKIAYEIDEMIEPHAMAPEDLENPYDTLATEIREYGVEI